MKECMCGGRLEKTIEKREGVRLRGMKCIKCGEVYIGGDELLKFEILTGRRKSLARKVSRVGASKVVRIPSKILEQFNIKLGDYVVFEPKRDEISLKVVKG